jgi:GTP-binding protein
VFDVDGRWYLVDLPGYGFARLSHSERATIGCLLDNYLATRKTLAGVVWVLDIRRDLSPEDRAMADRFSRGSVPTLVAIAKADKVPRGQRLRRSGTILGALNLTHDRGVVTSAHSGEGMEDLRDSIEALIGASA